MTNPIPYLLETAQELLATATYESQTYKSGVLVHWLVGLLESTSPGTTPTLFAITDPETGEPLDEILEEGLLEVRVRQPDGIELTGQCVLTRLT